jgi:hypothetical protein
MLDAFAKRYLNRSSRYSPRLNSSAKPIALLDAPPSEAKSVGTPDPKPKASCLLFVSNSVHRVYA